MPSALPQNQARFSLAEIAALTQGTLSGAGDIVVNGVATDSRGPVAGKLFVALTGDRFDGHAFASAALRGGARALLVEHDVGDARVPLVRVASTTRALGLLGAAQRKRWSGRLAAIAGSAGKTTMRSALSAALDALAPGRVHFVHGNLNNRIGVPLVLLGLEERHDYAVVEIGTNATGEVAELAELASPEVGILTLVGLEHTEGLGSLDAIELEEASLFAAVKASGAALGNADDERVLRQLGRVSLPVRRSYGFAQAADYRVVERTVLPLGAARLRIGRPALPVLELECPLLGRAGASALAGSLLAAEVLSGQSMESSALLAAYARVGIGEPGRLTPVRLANGSLILDDSYNSNPASLTSSVAAAAELARARGGRLLLALGEMRELGDDSLRLHREAGEALREFGASWVIAVSGDARWLLEPLDARETHTRFALDAPAAALMILELLAPSDTLLVKASRGVRAERIVLACVERFGKAE